MREHLHTYLNSADYRFDWQSNNCCHFASNWVRSITGRDIMSTLAATHNPVEAAEMKESLGGLKEAVTKYLGEPRSGDIRTGDIALLKLMDVEVLGICTGNKVVCLSEGGMLTVNARVASYCWSPV